MAKIQDLRLVVSTRIRQQDKLGEEITARFLEEYIKIPSVRHKEFLICLQQSRSPKQSNNSPWYSPEYLRCYKQAL